MLADGRGGVRKGRSASSSKSSARVLSGVGSFLIPTTAAHRARATRQVQHHYAGPAAQPRRRSTPPTGSTPSPSTATGEPLFLGRTVGRWLTPVTAARVSVDVYTRSLEAGHRSARSVASSHLTPTMSVNAAPAPSSPFVAPSMPGATSEPLPTGASQRRAHRPVPPPPSQTAAPIVPLRHAVNTSMLAATLAVLGSSNIAESDSSDDSDVEFEDDFEEDGSELASLNDSVLVGEDGEALSVAAALAEVAMSADPVLRSVSKHKVVSKLVFTDVQLSPSDLKVDLGVCWTAM
jgi:hypothetical protein